MPSAPATDSRPVAWFHGVSVGEVNLLKIVVAEQTVQAPAAQQEAA